VDGGIYTVYLKKVRYNTPSRSVNDDQEDHISHLEWETVRVRFMKAGTLEKLVESLASDTGELESTYINVFLATYRTFASAKQVLNLLTERYEQLGELGSPERVEQYRRTLRQALHVWLDQFPEDYKEPPNFPCLSHLETFCRRVMPGSELDSKVQRKGKIIRKESSMKESPLIQQLLESSRPPPSRYSSRSQSLPSYSYPPYSDILDIPTKHFAQQITAMDNELFKRVIPHQCLGSVWSRRDKSRDRDAATVVATIEQFNAVSYRVISTVLIDCDAKNSARGRVISAWIDIAQELRMLKNFSSLKAIVSGLQSNPVFRLRKAWQSVPKDKLEVFEELARIFSEDNNAVAQRELLVREGTARFADTVGENDHHLQKMLQKHQENSRAISYGTIPYLGTFLTDLTMIDTAVPDIVSEGLINFDKRRKEFEVLAQIKLLQGAANAYTIEPDSRFARWFESVLIMDENEAHELSCQIEPTHPSSSSANDRKESRFKRRITPIINHRKNDSIASTVSGSSSSSTPMLCETDGSVKEEEVPDVGKLSVSSCLNDSMRSRLSSASSLSTPSLDSSLVNTSPGKADTPDKAAATSAAGSPDPYKTPDFYIIRVSWETSSEATEGVIMYKSIMLSNREHTREVICSAMMKHGIEGSPDDFTLSQVLPDKELQIPPNANVYYAINTQHDLNFVLRPRGDISKERDKEAELFKATPGRKRDTSKARRKLLGLAL